MILIIRVNAERNEGMPLINGSSMYLELDGKAIPFQRSLIINATPDEQATCTVEFLMPVIKYKGE